MTDPLPDLFELSAFGGDYQAYEDALFYVYLNRIVRGGLRFRGLPVKTRRTPEYKGKGAGFWHLLTEGRVEEQRTPDFRRCERLPWVPWVIRHADDPDDTIRVWTNKRGSNTNVVLWLWEEDYAVILSERRGFYLLVSAYTLRSRRIDDFEREWRQSLKNS